MADRDNERPVRSTTITERPVIWVAMLRRCDAIGGEKYAERARDRRRVPSGPIGSTDLASEVKKSECKIRWGKEEREDSVSKQSSIIINHNKAKGGEHWGHSARGRPRV
jgi:hypothetical protein